MSDLLLNNTAASREPLQASFSDAANPLGLDGIEFIEYATTKPQALGQVLEMMGFRPVARHRSREILLYRQGGLNIVVNAHPSDAQGASHGSDVPSISAMALRVRDARAAYHYVLERGAWSVPTHAEVMEHARRFSAQLCTAVKLDGGQDYALASKTFDYIRAGRPILGLVGPGAQRAFLERCGMATLADPDDLEACVAALGKVARGGYTMSPDRGFLEGLIFWRKPEPAGDVVDPEAEAARLKTNAEQGLPVTAGETPIIKRRKKALLEGIF